MGGRAGTEVDVWKYARPEFERRFLLSAVPTGRVLRRRHIVDRYFIGTGLRLRAVSSDTGDHTYNLTQKIPEAVDGARGRITAMYLPLVAYALLSELPGADLCKTRLSVPPLQPGKGQFESCGSSTSAAPSSVGAGRFGRAGTAAPSGGGSPSS
jgi:hypothetical protein